MDKNLDRCKYPFRRALPLINQILLAVSLLFGHQAAAFDRSEDVSGSTDYPGIERYPKSKIDIYSSRQSSDYQLALGSLKKVNGQLVPEYSERLEGRLTRITYRIPDGHKALTAFNHFAAQLSSADLLFECHGRECGSSSHWANQIFGIAKLYGPERYQHYRVARLKRNNDEILVVLYAVQRGNKRVYVHLDLLEPAGQGVRDIAVNPETLLSNLLENKRLVLTGLTFDENDRLLEQSQKSIEQVVAALKKNVRLRVYVVGHIDGRTGDSTIDQLIERSQQRAAAVQTAIIKQGITANRLEAHGVGPLAPSSKPGLQSGRIELVVR